MLLKGGHLHGRSSSDLLATADKTQRAQASQERIDSVVRETQDLESQYKQIMKEIEARLAAKLPLLRGSGRRAFLG